jgi:hypothetical protein
MQLFDPNNPSERKKAIAAAVLAIVAIAILGYVFFGGSGSSGKPQTNKNAIAGASPRAVAIDPAKQQPGDTLVSDDMSGLTPIPASWTAPSVGEPNRNIFAYYEPTPTPTPVKPLPTPTPTPTPPLTLSSLNPSNVYARTADFNLELTGDKFTPAVRVVIDGRELPTRFISARQVAATVPASLITNPGSRQVVLRSSDGALYSLPSMINVMPPPLPNYNYIGIIGKPRANDVAVLQDKSSKELLNVQRGDVLGGRFRVTSISERELVLTDTSLKIKHTIAFTVDSNPNSPLNRQVPRVSDEEPM